MVFDSDQAKKVGFQKGHKSFRTKELAINCKFCSRHFFNEEKMRTHTLFAHNFLMPNCTTKAIETHVIKIDALRKLYHKLRRRIYERSYNEAWHDYTKHLMRVYESQFQEHHYYYSDRFNYQKEKAHFISKSQYERRALFNHNLDVKNFCFIKRELDKNGILIDV